MKNVLEVKSLVKKFNDFVAVNNVSFQVRQGEILGLLGPNGAGKTTIIQMLLSTMTPTSGSIIYFDKDFSAYRTEILQKVSFASTYVRLPGRLTIQQNLDIYGELYGVSYADRKKRIERFLKFFGIWDIKDREAGVLSAGQMTRVMLAKAFISYPAIVLLDEPTASLDPDIALEVRKFIKEQQQEYGVSILLTSHNMDEVTEVCDRVMVLQNGVIVANNTPVQLAASVTNSRVQLLITKNLDIAHNFLNEHKFVYRTMGKFTEIELNEQKIAQLLSDLSKLNIYYDQISIDKPTLEDYFLQLARRSRKKVK